MKSNDTDDKIDWCMNNPWTFLDVDLDDIGKITYWREGGKRERDRRVEFVNSDPRLVSI